jgi:hypothetical protein
MSNVHEILEKDENENHTIKKYGSGQIQIRCLKFDSHPFYNVNKYRIQEVHVINKFDLANTTTGTGKLLYCTFCGQKLSYKEE